MSEPNDAITPEEEEANRLYWGSDLSVNALADRLGLSKSRLYEVIRPLPAGTPCPECGGTPGFPNRTARDRGLAECPECGAEVRAKHQEDGSPVPPSSRKVADTAEPGEIPGRGDELGEGTDHPGYADLSPSRVGLLAGGIVVGLAAGFFLGLRMRD